MRKLRLLDKTYTEEELCDMARDIYEALNLSDNPSLASANASGGVFRVVLTWEEEAS